jgi:hypothetical protein
VDGAVLNSERGLVERILSRAAYHLHRRMISAALGAGISPQLSACIREMRIFGIASSGAVATCKTRIFGPKSGRIRYFRMFRVAEREKI